MHFIKKTAASSIKFILRILPKSAPAFIYTVILKPAPLRNLTNSILKTLIPIKINVGEANLFLNQEDPVVSGALALGAFEKYEINLFKSYLKTEMTVVDIGANIGYYTMISAKAVGQNGKVIAFEPEPVNFSFLEKNITENNLSNVIAVKKALSDKDGEITLFLNKDNKGRHSMIDYQKNTVPTKVETTTLDNFLKIQNISKVDVIKMDVEGAEALVLEGMTETLKNARLIMFIEFFPKAIQAGGKDPRKFLERITENGFLIYEINERNEKLDKVSDIEKLIYAHSKENPANLLCQKSENS